MLDAVRIPSNELFAVLTATSFAAGLNVYATIATIGVLAHTGVFPLPPGLQLLSSWSVIACSGILFLVEVFADKIPVFDLLWNALHTFIRVPVAALLAYRATAQLPSAWQLFATLLGGAIALAAHSGKTAVRAAVTPYPEPFSNVTLSLGGGYARRISDMVCHKASLLGGDDLPGICAGRRRFDALGRACPSQYVAQGPKGSLPNLQRSLMIYSTDTGLVLRRKPQVEMNTRKLLQKERAFTMRWIIGIGVVLLSGNLLKRNK